jgi:signal transduction histidine kinase/ActR/RegA family two-component response regulator
MPSAGPDIDSEKIALAAYISRYREVFRVRLLTIAGLSIAVAASFSIVTAIEYLVSSYAAFAIYIWAVEAAARRLDEPGAGLRLRRQSTVLDFVVSLPSVALALYVNAAAPQLHIECQLLVITLVMLAGLQVHLANTGLFASIAPPLSGLLLITLPDLPPAMLTAHLWGGALFTGALVAASWRQLRSDRQSAREAAELATRNADLESALSDSQEQRLSAQAANRAKTEFLANISHEIRTPLNGIMGMAQVMQQARLGKAQRAQLAIVQSSARNLLETVNAVLDISRIEAGEMEIAPTVFSLDHFAQAVEQLYRPIATDKGLALSVEVDPAVNGWRHGDEVRLRQVLSNLVSNAVKFTDAGSVEVRVSGDADRLVVTVSDTGVGIAPESRARIFERFAQADGSTTRRFAGAGLGLAICRETLDLLGGAIALEDAGAIGSRFVFEVPYPRAAPAEEPATAAGLAEPSANTPLRLLVVDDNATNRTVLQAMLTPFGATVDTAADGLEALAAWEAGRWDVILMDIHMPRMDGLEACRAIRKRETATGQARTPIIAVTASVLTHETQAYLTAGMDDVIPKPVELQRLIAGLEASLAPPPIEAAELAARPC